MAEWNKGVKNRNTEVKGTALIVGASLSGLMAGIALAQAGLQVTSSFADPTNCLRVQRFATGGCYPGLTSPVKLSSGVLASFILSIKNT